MFNKFAQQEKGNVTSLYLTLMLTDWKVMESVTFTSIFTLKKLAMSGSLLSWRIPNVWFESRVDYQIFLDIINHCALKVPFLNSYNKDWTLLHATSENTITVQLLLLSSSFLVHWSNLRSRFEVNKWISRLIGCHWRLLAERVSQSLSIVANVLSMDD